MMDVIPYRACHIDRIQRTMLFSSSLFNGIFRMDLKSGSVQSIGMIQGEKVFQSSLYGGIVAYRGWLFLVPLAAHEIAVLERESGRCVRKIRLPGHEEIVWKFAAGIVYGDEVILIPARYPYFLSVNMIALSVNVLADWKAYLAVSCALDDQKQLSAFTAGRLADNLYLQVLDTDRLLKFNMRTKQIIGVIDLPNGHYAYGICDEKDIYAVPSKSGEILRISGEDDQIERTYPMPIKIDEDIIGYASIHGRIVHERLILFPQKAKRIGVVDLITGKADAIPFDHYIDKKKENIFQRVEMIDERYCIALVCYGDKNDYGCFIVDTVDLSMEYFKMDLEQSVREIVKGCIQKSIEQDKLILEYTLQSLGIKEPSRLFITAIEERAEREHPGGDSIGAKIYGLLEGD